MYELQLEGEPEQQAFGEFAQHGRLAGKIDEAFFEPLPEQELDAWEGK